LVYYCKNTKTLATNTTKSI